MSRTNTNLFTPVFSIISQLLVWVTGERSLLSLSDLPLQLPNYFSSLRSFLVADEYPFEFPRIIHLAVVSIVVFTSRMIQLFLPESCCVAFVGNVIQLGNCGDRSQLDNRDI